MKAGHVIVGLEVHKNSIVAAVLPPEQERVTETIWMEHAPEAVARFVRRVARRGETEFV